jgi:hypothetical protein
MTTSALAGRLERSALARAVASPWLASLVLFAGVVALTRPATFNAPLEYDPPLYLYGGNLILHGHTPYVDMIATKGPATYLLFALIQLVAGTSVVVVHLTLVLFAALTAGALAAYVGHFAGRAAGFLAGLVFALFSATSDLEGYSSNTEQYGVAPMVGAWWLSTRKEWWATGLAGGLTAFAALMNPAFAVVVPFVAFELWRSAPAGRGRRFAYAAAGVAVVAVPILLWIALSGGFGDMLDQVFGYARSGVGGGGGRFWHVPAPSLWVLGVIGCAIAMRDARLRRVAIPALLWIFAAWLRVKVANYSYSHHYYPALPGIAAGIALGIASLWRRSLLERVAICALVLAAPLWSEVLRFQGHGLRQPATLRFYKTASHPYHLAYPVSAFIRAHTSPSDTIYMAGGLPGIEAKGAPGVYWLADRFSATRYIDTPPARWVPAGYAAERRRDLLEHPPKAIGLMPQLRVDPDLRDVLRRYRYRLAFETLGARVWLRPGA